MKFIPMTEPLYDYLVAHGHNGDPVLAELAKETAGARADLDDADRAGAGHVDVDPDQRHRRDVGGRDRHVHGLQRALRGTRPPPEGKLLCCDISEEWTSIARRYWAKAGVADRIELRLAPALETLAALPARSHVRLRLHRRRQGVLPRLLRSAAAAHADERADRLRQRSVDGSGARCRARIRRHARPAALNDHIAADKRVEAVMISVSDGLTIVRKK